METKIRDDGGEFSYVPPLQKIHHVARLFVRADCRVLLAVGCLYEEVVLKYDLFYMR